MTDARRISRDLAASLRGDWHSLARKEQLAPPANWTTWLLMSGRDFGKTRAGAQWINEQVEAGVKRIAIIGSTASAVRDIMVEGPSGILACAPDWNRPIYESSKRRITWPSGATATCFASEEPRHLRGPEHEIGWLDELATFQSLDECWNMFRLGLRVGKHPRCLITTTPKPLALIRDLVKRAANGNDVVVVRGSTYDNRANLSEAFFDQIIRKYEGTRIGRQELLAELLTDVEGALWTWTLIESCRVDHAPAMRRIVVSIDPAASVSETSDETGIVVCGLGVDNHAYVLEDLSAKLSPIAWANKACSAYRRHKADRIVAESNMGGAMVETTLRAVDRNVPVTLVHASRGKITRAEPISTLYEQGASTTSARASRNSKTK